MKRSPPVPICLQEKIEMQSNLHKKKCFCLFRNKHNHSHQQQHLYPLTSAEKRTYHGFHTFLCPQVIHMPDLWTDANRSWNVPDCKHSCHYSGVHVYARWFAPGPSQLTEVLLISCNSDMPTAMQGNAIYLIPLLVKLHHGTFAVLLLRSCTQFLKPS